MRPIYTAGDMLTTGSRMQREHEKKLLEKAGLPVYNPMDDKEINDKANLSVDANNGLAEKIVFKDTLAIKKATHVVIEPQSFAQGTLVELGQIKAYNEMRSEILRIVAENTFGDSNTTVNAIVDYLTNEVPHKKVYAHLGDVRRTDIPESGDRRSFGVNQYVYGVVLELTEGKGFMPFEDIVEELIPEDI